VVLTALNLTTNFHHYYRSLNGWPFAVFNYWSEGFMSVLDAPETQQMAQIIDPIYFRQYWTMPKLVIAAASDEFFMPDNFDYFYKDLIGEKHIWLVENSGHRVNLYAGDIYWQMLETFYVSVLQDYERPSLTWTKKYTATGGSIVIQANPKPLSVTVFSALSAKPNRRDWRLHVQNESFQVVSSGVEWKESPAKDVGHGFRAEFANPSSGYRAFYIRATFAGPKGRVFYETTDIAVVPNNFPYPDCSGAACQGTLL